MTRYFIGLGLAALCTAAAAADDDAITPYRPSVSSPAQLPVPGQLEIELGGLHARSDDSRRSSECAKCCQAHTDEVASHAIPCPW